MGPKSLEASPVEKAASLGPSSEEVDSELDHERFKRVWMKFDLWVVPIACMFYLLSFLDRVNLGNARVAGLQTDLKLTNHQYSVALTVTYVPYILSELPSNLLLKIVGPNIMLPAMVVSWGVITALQGVVKNYAGLLACRFFLGFFEGGLIPGLAVYLALFYPRHRLQGRISIFFSSAALAGAFSGLLAYAIINLDGKGGKPGWAWIFILEGGFTTLFGLAVWPIMAAGPESARFLSQDERDYVVEVLRRDGAKAKGSEDDKFSWDEVKMAFKLPHMWIMSVSFFCDGTILYSLAYFSPSIIQSLGYTSTQAQLMSVPPFAASFVIATVGAWISDHYECRGAVATFSCAYRSIGFALFLTGRTPGVRYTALFFCLPGTYLGAPTAITWMANNVSPHLRRATVIAFACVLTNSGGILSTWLLGTLSKPPLYQLGTKVLLALGWTMFVSNGANWLYLWQENKKKAKIRATMSQADEKPGLGDRSAWFIYAL